MSAMDTKSSKPKPYRVTYSTIDHFRETRRFATLKGAQAYAARRVGETPEISDAFGYAVSAYGTGKVECDGCTIRALFPKIEGDDDEFDLHAEVLDCIADDQDAIEAAGDEEASS